MVFLSFFLDGQQVRQQTIFLIKIAQFVATKLGWSRQISKLSRAVVQDISTRPWWSGGNETHK